MNTDDRKFNPILICVYPRSSAAPHGFHSSFALVEPLPVAYFRHIVTMCNNVVLVIHQFIAHSFRSFVLRILR